MKAKTQSSVQLTISLDDLANAVSNLSSRELEEIELAFSPEEEKEIVKRKKELKQSGERAEVTITELQENFGRV
jgi:hypothetical protein